MAGAPASRVAESTFFGSESRHFFICRYDVQLDWGFTWYGREEHTITIGTNGVLSFGTPQYMYGGSEPVPCHGHSQCSDGR